MQALIYYLVRPILYIISLLPFRILYILSDILYVIVYKLIGYRTRVVNTNLQNSFPEKSTAEIKQIQDSFYRYLCDLILETVKTISITPKSLKKHVKFIDMAAFDRFYKQQQSVIIVMGHQGNWELGGARFSQDPYHQLYVIYHPLANKYFDKMFYYMRTRLGNKLYAMKDTIRGMIKNKTQLTATAFIADQTPSPHNAYWTTFLNQETPVFTGTAKIAKKLNYPIIYVSITRPKRGLYEVNSELLVENPANMDEDHISELHTKRLEKDIQTQPEIWLWTHKRWKHKKPIA